GRVLPFSDRQHDGHDDAGWMQVRHRHVVIFERTREKSIYEGGLWRRQPTADPYCRRLLRAAFRHEPSRKALRGGEVLCRKATADRIKKMFPPYRNELGRHVVNPEIVHEARERAAQVSFRRWFNSLHRRVPHILAQSRSWEESSSGGGRGATRRGDPLPRRFHELSAKRKHHPQPIQSRPSRLGPVHTGDTSQTANTRVAKTTQVDDAFFPVYDARMRGLIRTAASANSIDLDQR